MFRVLNHPKIRTYIKQQNTCKWTTLFGQRTRGDTIKFVNELFDTCQRSLVPQSNYRIIANYGRDFITRINSIICEYLSHPGPYVAYATDNMKTSVTDGSNNHNTNHRNSSYDNKK